MVLSETYKKSISMTLEGKQDSFHSLVFQWLTTCNRKQKILVSSFPFHACSVVLSPTNRLREIIYKSSVGKNLPATQETWV